MEPQETRYHCALGRRCLAPCGQIAPSPGHPPDQTRRARRWLSGVLVWAAFAASLLLFAPGAAAFPIHIGDGNKLHLDGESRVFYTYLTSFKLDETGKSVGDPGIGQMHHRLRLSPYVTIGDKWKIFGQIDLLYYDSLYGFDTTIGSGDAKSFPAPLRDQASGFRPVDPRQLWLSWLSPIGRIRFGQMSSHWGLGIIANNGESQTGEFSAPRFGDLVERLVLATPILRIFGNNPVLSRVIFAAGIDIVFRDENAELLEGDFALQGVFSLFYKYKKDVFVGAYFAIRSQQDRNQGPTLDVKLLDFFMRLRGHFYDGAMAFELATEATWLTGFTNRIRTEEAPQGLEISAGAIVGRLGLRFPKIGLRFGFEVGFASGDNDINDGASRLFRFDPDYQPSLIIFRHVLAAVSANGADRAIDPNRLGFPPPGSDQIPSFGQIGNTLYIQPVVALKPFITSAKALRPLELKFGLLYARTVADLIDPFNSFRAGGTNTTYFNLPALERKDLGIEINVALSYRYSFWENVGLAATLVYGHFFPGSAFDEDGNGKVTPIDMFQARIALQF